MIIASKAVTSAPTLPYLWVAVGASGGLQTSTSTTASSWTAQTSSFGTTGINAVAANPQDVFVAVGDTGKLATSPDGTNWTQRTSSFGTTAILAVAYGNGIWVAGGAAGTVATATDPTGTWTQRTTGFSTSFDIASIVYGEGIWVGLNRNGDIRTATDPTGTWTSRTSTLGTNSKFWSGGYSTSIGTFVQGLDNTATLNLASSPDGITWTARSTPNAAGTVLPPGRLTSLQNLFILGYQTSTASCDIATSADGITWTDRTPAITASTPATAATDGTTAVILNTSGANGLQTSTDGITWTARTAPSFGANGMCHSTNATP